MTIKALFKPLLIAVIVLNIAIAAWHSRSDAEEFAATPAPPPRSAGCPGP
jgi:hypothetical protein